MTVSLEAIKQRIKTRVPLDQLIGETAKVIRRGTSLVACCPFHNEKTPSFHIYPDGHYYCYGCKENGDAITFVRKTREMSFLETLRFLANKYGIEAPELEESEKIKFQRNEQAVLSQIMAAAQNFFTEELATERGRPAVEYLKTRGFSEEQVKQFGFGLTPREGFGLVRHLRSLGFRPDDVVRASLAAISSSTGKTFDFFRDRIMIPIRDPHGRVVAFGGRTTVGDPAKYKNSAATPLFDKSGVLFGLDTARDVIREKKKAVIVEGYMDALSLWAGGFSHVVACMGTSLTARQLKVLSQQTKVQDVVIMFDGDHAGQDQTLNKVDIALEVPELRVKAARIPDGYDPDTYLSQNGLEALQNVIDQAQDLIDVAISARLGQASPGAVPQILNQELIPWMVKIQDPIKSGFLMSKVSQLSGVPMDYLMRQVRSFKFASTSPLSPALESFARGGLSSPPLALEKKPLEKPRALIPIEVGVLGHLYFARPGEFDVGVIQSFVTRDLALDPIWDLFARQCIQFLQEQKVPSEHPEFLAIFSVEEVGFVEVVTRQDPNLFGTENRQQSIERLLLEHSRRSIQKSLALVRQQIQVAVVQNRDDVEVLLSEVRALSTKLSEVDRNILKL